MADISNIINVALLAGGKSASRDNMNTVCVMTGEQGVLSSADRYSEHKTAKSVEDKFGSLSVVTDFANSFFATQPNATDFGGTLVVGYYRASEEVTEATNAVLTGAQLNETATLKNLQSITDGSFNISVDSVEKTIDSLNFQTCADMNDVIAKIDSALVAAGATVSFVNSRVVLTSDTDGASSLLTFATAALTGTFVGNLLGLSDGTGASVVAGSASETLAVETKTEGIAAVKAEVNIKGACFTEKVLDGEVPSLATWAKANAVIIYGVFTGASYLQINTSNPVWELVLSSATSFRALHSKAGNLKLAVSYMARAHTVNFNAENSAMTMNLKELSVPAESYDDGEVIAAKRVGLDIYTTIKNTPVVLSSPANDFVDNVYNITAFIDAVQTDMFNHLKSTSTKIGQTEEGVLSLVDQGEKTTKGFVTAGVFAPGTWSSPDSFGNIDVFKRSIAQFGFYWLAGKLADQSQADREQRKSPVLQAAVKNKGAIHEADIIINFNK